MRCGAVRFPANASRELASGCKPLANIVIRAAARRPRGPTAARVVHQAQAIGSSRCTRRCVHGQPLGSHRGRLGLLPLYVAAIRVYVAAICNDAGSRGLPCREGGSVSLVRNISGAENRCERHGTHRYRCAVRARGRDRTDGARAIRREHRRISRRPFVHQNGPARPIQCINKLSQHLFLGSRLTG